MHKREEGRGGKPVLLVILDGVGLSEKDHGNVVKHAELPNLRYLKEKGVFCTLKAHGRAVGLPSDKDMGNSEVGHNALGSGQIYAQGARLVNEAIESGRILESATWKNAVSHAKSHSLHLLGLLSDGNVHSHIDHLKALVKQAKIEGIKKVAIHALLDGRDVAAQSAHVYIKELEDFLAGLNDPAFHARIVSGGGRMVISMDRYNADWAMVERGWRTHVLAEAKVFPSALDAVEYFRRESPGIIDQDIPPFVIGNEAGEVKPIVDGDAVILFNFRGDRAIEISRAFEEGDNFREFDRIRVPKVYFAGMLEYDGDLHIPKNYLVDPPHIEHCLTEQMNRYGLKQFALSETQKFGHVTYFWNGNKLEPFSEELEVWQEIPGDQINFALKPWMKSYEITEALLEAIAGGEYDFLRVNYPNGDMVGHTGDYQASLIGLEAVDLALGRLIEAVDEAGITLILLSDHGNCEEMYQEDPKLNPKAQAKTSHTLNPVPCIIYGHPGLRLKEGEFGLANIAATIAKLLHFPAHPQWEESIIE